MLFSGISPNFNQLLREELFGCFKYIHIPYSELMKMPTRDRKFYIQKHNEVTAAENKKSGNTMEISGEAMNNVSDGTLNRGF
jgi:hypothetical protein